MGAAVAGEDAVTSVACLRTRVAAGMLVAVATEADAAAATSEEEEEEEAVEAVGAGLREEDVVRRWSSGLFVRSFLCTRTR